MGCGSTRSEFMKATSNRTSPAMERGSIFIMQGKKVPGGCRENDILIAPGSVQHHRLAASGAAAVVVQSKFRLERAVVLNECGTTAVGVWVAVVS